ncbi:hypothetical protein DPMN_193619 [Dreissena polymorpha]|uniref:Uncharacterized protein n=1 Tax=Dreissena polymorpha TaxID=45954 RepID=A0A9D4BC50_DREPO|nr:hypothetical protein DPMN_193619 [Dreissena polymorpha]
MELLVRNPLSLVITAVNMDILNWTSALLEQSVDRTAPKHLKLVTSSSFSPLMSVLVLFVLFTVIVNFSVLTSTQYAPALL